eukprot:TRINITY_DN3107_c0_g1_i5.p2 TRINITY_DN3107_c0_g1~~TRINITY_DN3107_c0_g1_i5.p2  ORF type:complete len:155 (-),score=19.94 TRINITY_DN3107_c0_g1_i5:49-513(-)
MDHRGRSKFQPTKVLIEIMQFLNQKWITWKENIDENFSYTTVKLVKIKDRRLGFLHYGCNFGLIIIIVLTIMVNKTYLTFEKPVGSFSFEVKRPEFVDMDKYPYCKPPNQCVQMSPEEGKRERERERGREREREGGDPNAKNERKTKLRAARVE